MMISRMIRSKGSTPHSIVRAELGAAPMVVEALFRAVSFLHRIREFPGQRYSRLALVSSQQIAAEGDKDCWYSQMTTWLSLHGLDIDRLPPYNYSLDCPTLNFSRSELNRVIRADILRINTERTWIRPSLPLGSRMEFYRSHFLHLTQDGFVTRPQYMDIHLTHSMRAAIGQIRTASHRLRTETGRWTDIAEEDRICQLCSREPETEEHYICRCTVYYDIRGRYHCLFREGFGPLRRIMEYEDQRCLGLLIMELHRRRTALLRARTTTCPEGPTQRALTDFFSTPAHLDTPSWTEPVPPHQTSQTQRRGVTLDRAVALCRTRRPRPSGPRPRGPHHQQIRAIIARHRRLTPRHINSATLDTILADIMGGP